MSATASSSSRHATCRWSGAPQRSDACWPSDTYRCACGDVRSRGRRRPPRGEPPAAVRWWARPRPAPRGRPQAWCTARTSPRCSARSRLLGGTMTYLAGEEDFVLSEGSFIYLPEGLPHAVREPATAGATVLLATDSRCWGADPRLIRRPRRRPRARARPPRQGRGQDRARGTWDGPQTWGSFTCALAPTLRERCHEAPVTPRRLCCLTQ